MNDGLWQDKVDLAAALRLAVRCQFDEGIDNHFTFGLPGRQDRYFLHPYGLHWSEIRASDLLRTYLLTGAEVNAIVADGTISIFADLFDTVGFFNPPNFVEVTAPIGHAFELFGRDKAIEGCAIGPIRGDQVLLGVVDVAEQV